MNMSGRRVLVAIFVVAGLFAAAYGAAAALGVGGGTIQAGSDTDLRCDEDGVRVAGWGLELDDGKVYSVRVYDIDAGCRDSDSSEKELMVNITSGGTKVAEGKAKLPTDGGTGDKDGDTGEVGVSVSLNNAVPAKDITDIEIFIESDAND
jgi:hypothetical protein